ncbi:MAG: ribosome biogenesis GTP-binding protein YihA/YsxC [Lachnospiraceae bacterium]|nr:ribosome biogenesis GTP-binding protein YihA/YsxC [Lachnospiraceae bacterium]
MKIRSAELKTVIGVKSKVPENSLPEFAFAGKSNVGKSSLINALMQRKSLARTSSTPGKTQTVNYYEVDAITGTEEASNRLILVDLPGYGYTKASPDSRLDWGKMVERYLKASATLQKVFLLVDIRHTPGENDVMMYDWIKAKGFEPIVIATKLDKLKKNEISGAIKDIRKTLEMKNEDVLIPFSSETKKGIEEIYNLLFTTGEAKND